MNAVPLPHTFKQAPRARVAKSAPEPVRGKRTEEEETVEPPTFDAEIPDATVSKKGLTTFQAAQRLGVSPSWIKQHVDDLGGRLTRKGYRFSTDITLERVTEKIKIRASSKTANSFAKEDREGDIARKVFERLNRKMTPREIVVELGVEPDKVLQLMAKWIKCGQAETTLAIVHGDKEPPAPAAAAQPTMVSPHGVPMRPFASPLMPPPEPSSSPSPSTEPRGSGLAATMRAEAEARIAASDAAVEAMKRRMQAETAKFDDAVSPA